MSKILYRVEPTEIATIKKEIPLCRLRNPTSLPSLVKHCTYMYKIHSERFVNWLKIYLNNKYSVELCFAVCNRRTNARKRAVFCTLQTLLKPVRDFNITSPICGLCFKTYVSRKCSQKSYALFRIVSKTVPQDSSIV